jgi:hypothetical protein
MNKPRFSGVGKPEANARMAKNIRVVVTAIAATLAARHGKGVKGATSTKQLMG